MKEKGTPGFTATAIEGKCALRGIENADIIFSNCFIPAANKMRPGGFSNNTKRVLESSRALVAAACTGLVIGAANRPTTNWISRKQMSA